MKDFNDNDDRAADELIALLFGPDKEPRDLAEEGMNYLYDRKYALAEPVIKKNLNSLQEAMDQLLFHGKTIIAQMKVTDFDIEYAFKWAHIEIVEARYDLRQYLNTVQTKLAQGIKETTAEEAYQEWSQKNIKLNRLFSGLAFAIAFFTVSSAAILAYRVHPMLIFLPILLGAAAFFIVVAFFNVKGKNLGEELTSDVIDLARRDGKLL
jgi:hypothetical protein